VSNLAEAHNPLRASAVSAIRSTAEAVGHVREQAVAAEVDPELSWEACFGCNAKTPHSSPPRTVIVYFRCK